MTATPEVQERMRHYLLGQLRDDARQEIEQELLTNSELFEELLVTEDEIIDEYLGGILSPAERTQFEQHFLATPERQQNLRFARALNRYLTTVKTGPRVTTAQLLAGSRSSQARLFRIGAAVVAVALIIGALWLFRLRTTPPQTFVSITLTISQGNRAEGPAAGKVKLPLPADALRVSLRLPDPSAAVSYRADLQEESGAGRPLEIKAQDAQLVWVEIPASELRRGQYAIILFAINPDGTDRRINGGYFLTVE